MYIHILILPSVYCKFFPVNPISSFPHLKAALEAAEKKANEQDEKNTSEPLTLRLRTKNKMRVFDLMNGDGACHGDGANNTEETAEVCLKGQLYKFGLDFEKQNYLPTSKGMVITN
jgi:hypothetical protein